MDMLLYVVYCCILFTKILGSKQCEDIRVDLCSELSYSQTNFPNSLSHQTQQEAELQLSGFVPLIQYGCSSELTIFLCSVFVPKCSPYEHQSQPCKSLCEGVRNECKPILDHFGFPWPEALSCDNFPENGDCIGHSTSIEADATADPSIVDSEDTISVRHGQSAVLPCKVQNLGDHKVSWVFEDTGVIITLDDTRIIDDPRFSVRRDVPDEFNLVIQNVDTSNEAVYACMVNTDPAMKRTVSLAVLDLPDLVSIPAQILRNKSSSDLRIKEFGSATLLCQATGDPKPSINWHIKPFSEPPAGVNCDVVPFQSENCPGPLMHVVHILKITRHCAGIYQCIASNGETATYDIQVHVTGYQTPELQVSTPLVDVARGSSAFLRCHVTVSGLTQDLITIGWSKNGQPIRNGGNYKFLETLYHGRYKEVVLGIKNVHNDDFGGYLCSAELPQVGSWTGIATIEPAPDAPASQCQKINLDICQGLPYSSTHFPSTMQRGHNSEFDALEMVFNLAKGPFNSKQHCVNDHLFFRCSMLIPPCTSTGDIVLPCKSVCVSYKKTCYDSYWMAWHNQWECDKLPDQGDCITPKSMAALDTDDGSSPEVTFLPQILHQSIGGDVIIQCIAHMYPLGSLYFEKDGQILYNQGSVQHEVEFYNHGFYSYVLLLRLKSLDETDFGTYKCIAENSFGTSMKEIQVNDLADSDQLGVPQGAFVTTNSTKVKFTLGQTANLYFTFKLSHRGSQFRVIKTITFKKTNKKGKVSLKTKQAVLKTSDRIKMNFSHLPDNQILLSLKLLNVSNTDQADYTLELDDGGTKINDTVKLFVGMPPEVSVDGPIKFVPSGQFEASFKCEIHYGKNSYRWKLKRNGYTIDEHLRTMVTIVEDSAKKTDVLTVSIWEFSEEDAGQYSCVASNLHGSAQDSIVLLAATVPQVSLAEINGDASNVIQLSCSVTANPIADVSWTRNSLDGEKISSTGSERIEIHVNEATNTVMSLLSISNQDNLGQVQYFCVANNVVGTQHASLTLPNDD